MSVSTQHLAHKEGLACVQTASNGFISALMKADRKEEGRDRDGEREAAGEEVKGREECEAPERGVGDGRAA